MYYRTKTYLAGDWTGDKAAIDKLHSWNDSGYYSLDFVVTHYEQREYSEYYDIVTTYPLADYTSDLAARHGMSVSGNEEFNLASLQGLSSQILSKCDLDDSKEQDASTDELTDESTDGEN